MLPDLERLIRLQQLENTAAEARSEIGNLPSRLEALQARIDARQNDVKAATDRLEEHRHARAALEKDVAEVQTRVSRFKNQLMEVKTNREYQTMQTEIAGGEKEIQQLEDGLLELMLEGDEVEGNVKQAEQLLASEQEAVDKERAILDQNQRTLQEKLSEVDANRATVTDGLTEPTRALFESLTRGRNGLAVVEARGGLCTSCQVRLRPQLFNDVRSNTTLIQCENCQRILYFSVQPHDVS
jgi:predicted  nucleic acid-binding Zn-ribbon protein